jgi:hypothetical protein
MWFSQEGVIENIINDHIRIVKDFHKSSFDYQSTRQEDQAQHCINLGKISSYFLSKVQVFRNGRQYCSHPVYDQV